MGTAAASVVPWPFASERAQVYEHNVDNVLLRDPPALAATSPLLSRINLVPNMQQPCPGAAALVLLAPPRHAPTAPEAVQSRGMQGEHLVEMLLLSVLRRRLHGQHGRAA